MTDLLTIRRLAVSLAVVVALCCALPSQPALAHTQLVTSDPEAGATIAQLPEQVTLTFDEPLLSTGDVNHISVVDPMGEQIAAPAVLTDDTLLMSVLSPSMIMTGDYKVGFRAVAGDGHPVEGSFHFTVGTARPEASAIPVPASGTTVLMVHADGKQVPHGEGDSTGTATGSFTVDFAGKTICYVVDTSLPEVSGVHIHARNTDDLTVADEISIPVSLKALNSAKPVCGTPSPLDLAKLVATPDRFAMVIHTQDHPEGAVMGTFETANETPAATSDNTSASGSGPEPWVRVIAGLALVFLIAGGILVRRRASP